MSKGLLILATLDTKGKEAEFVRNETLRFGLRPYLMDIGLRRPFILPDIENERLALACGSSMEEIRKKGRAFGVKVMQEGGLRIAQELRKEGKIDGIIGLGGGTGTAISTYIMRGFPFGFPKVMVSTVASRNVREYVGVKDIFMFHSVADLLGFNSFTRSILSKAVASVCSMIRKGSSFRPEKPLVALTTYGINSICANYIEPLVRKRGYELICFHANGCGGMAMEEMIKEGFISGVLDLTLHEFVDDLYGGYCAGIGEERLKMAGIAGIPIVIAPGGLDNGVFSPSYPMPSSFKGRKIYHHDERFCVRMKKEELMLFAEIIGKKLNESVKRGYILIPKKGLSEIDKEGSDFFDREAITAFEETIKRIVRIPVEVLDLHISDPAFSERAVEILFKMMEAT